jgi:2-polyprenyl-6-methoxyphenol hydroxylase-like FAD-dependent oxidoreductase
LLTARVLTNHFDRVTIIERDQLPESPTFRMGAPHARHAHGLLVRGQQIMESYFPGLTAELLGQGALTANLGSEFLLSIGGESMKPFHSALEGLAFSRPLLENALFRRVRSMPQVQILDGRDVVGLITDDQKTEVTGIRIQQRGKADGGADHPIQELAADLVVDVSGRSSKMPDWLKELGYVPPQEITVDAQAGYASRIYRRSEPFSSWKAIYVMPKAPNQSRGGILLPMEGDRWLATLTGLNGDHPPTDEEGFMAFAKSVPVPELYNTIAKAEPLTEPYGYRKGANRLRLYDKLPRYLGGLLALGDSVYALNPVYGQGMTVASLGALTLDESLFSVRSREEMRDPALPRAFFKKLAKVNEGPWQMATGQDMRWPAAATENKMDPITQLIQRYFDRVLATMMNNSEVAEAFSHVQNMLKPPTSLFNPRIVAQVLMAKPQPAPAYVPVAQTELAHGR